MRVPKCQQRDSSLNRCLAAHNYLCHASSGSPAARGSCFQPPPHTPAPTVSQPPQLPSPSLPRPTTPPAGQAARCGAVAGGSKARGCKVCCNQRFYCAQLKGGWGESACLLRRSSAVRATARLRGWRVGDGSLKGKAPRAHGRTGREGHIESTETETEHVSDDHMHVQLLFTAERE